MGRPPLGKSARVITGTTKISRSEEDALRASYGTVHRGLRAAVDSLLHSVTATPLRVTDAPRAEDAKCRIHPEWELSEPWFDHGVEMVKKTCVVCGHEAVDRVK